MGFSDNIDVNSTFEAKIMALIMGLKLAVKMQYTQIVGSTDSIKLSTTLNDSYTNEHNLISICRDLLQLLGSPQVHYEKRSTNAVADIVIKEGNKLGSDSFSKDWIFSPLFVQNQLTDKVQTFLVGQFLSISMNVCINNVRPKYSMG